MEDPLELLVDIVARKKDDVSRAIDMLECFARQSSVLDANLITALKTRWADWDRYNTSYQEFLEDAVEHYDNKERKAMMASWPKF